MLVNYFPSLWTGRRHSYQDALQAFVSGRGEETREERRVERDERSRLIFSSTSNRF